MKSLRIFLASLLLLVTLPATSLLVGVTHSGQPYDPWVDLDDDGDIDIFDIVNMAGRYGTTGAPLNKTEMLLELQAEVEEQGGTLEWLLEEVERSAELNITVIELQSHVNRLNSSVAALEAKTVELETTIASLEDRIAVLETPGVINAPAYDSGWLSIAKGQVITLTHNLNVLPEKMFIYVLGYSSEPSTLFHQICYGGAYNPTPPTGWVGLTMYGVTPTQLRVLREPVDTYWEQVRVKVWIIQ